ncbi:hypothetical protein [Desertivirga brevis]|uniref:hypothetical protein n=1 Tax=Desertivirga brevis TaxID=2810310 RepID=UPI001A9751CA|nr:hypothetical protein [Pedobacter sp. SYSU D00873]
MKGRYLCFLVFLTALSLLLAPLTSQEQVEKVRADDYTTYIHPGPNTTHVASSLAQCIGELPVAIFHYIFISDNLGRQEMGEVNDHCFALASVPIFLSYRQILI